MRHQLVVTSHTFACADVVRSIQYTKVAMKMISSRNEVGLVDHCVISKTVEELALVLRTSSDTAHNWVLSMCQRRQRRMQAIWCEEIKLRKIVLLDGVSHSLESSVRT